MRDLLMYVTIWILRRVFSVFLSDRFPGRRKVELTGLERRAFELADKAIEQAKQQKHTPSADLSQHPRAVHETDETTLRWLNKGTNPVLFEADTGEAGRHDADIEPDE